MKNYYVYEFTNSSFIYKSLLNNKSWGMGINNYSFLDKKEQLHTITNYCIDYLPELTDDEYDGDDFSFFASVIWKNDTTPACVVYIDSLHPNIVNRNLKIINAFSDLYLPNKQYSHLNPDLPKIPLSLFHTSTFYHPDLFEQINNLSKENNVFIQNKSYSF